MSSSHPPSDCCTAGLQNGTRSGGGPGQTVPLAKQGPIRFRRTQHLLAHHSHIVVGFLLMSALRVTSHLCRETRFVGVHLTHESVATHKFLCNLVEPFACRIQLMMHLLRNSACQR